MNNHPSFSCHVADKNSLLEKYCTPVQKSFLNRSAACINYKKDELIFHEHFPSSNVYFVLSGIAALWKENIYSKKQYIRFVKEGELFGFRGSAMENACYRLSASAFEEAKVCYISKELFTQVLKENPTLHFNILITYVKEMEKIENNFCHHLSMNVREKVAEALLTIQHICAGNGTSGLENGNGTHFCKKMLRKDIADIAGISLGKTINILTELRNENIISTCGSDITLLKPDKLKEIVAEYHE